MTPRDTETESERRVSSAPLEYREQGKLVTVRGYAAVYGRESEDLGGFIEFIEPGAFADVMADDCRVLFNHDANLILARTAAGTARLWADSVGLGYEFTIPDTNAGRDLVVSMRRRDVTQSSFAFRVDRNGQRWVREGEKVRRYITRVARLYDVSPVTYPAYPDTSVALREMRARFGQMSVGPSAGGTPIAVLRRRLELAERAIA